MGRFVVELRDIYKELQSFADGTEAADITKPLAALEKSANTVGKAWSHSWLGYQSKVYYQNLNPPPPGAHFSSEWGFIDGVGGLCTYGDWKEYDADAVKNEIAQKAGSPDLGSAKESAKRGMKLFDEKRDQIVSILETANSRRKDSFLERLREEAMKERVVTASDYVGYLHPPGPFMSRDTLALSQGLWTPPHVAVLAEVAALRSPSKVCGNLAKMAQKAAAHLERVEREQARSDRIGTNVFIGHGSSSLWKDLKDFIQDRLQLPWDEFNRVPIAGITNIARLSEMLDAAAIAFIVMTAEDEQADGRLQARMNVIHEAGLFQGRLGFTKAIILLEEGCEEFSNIEGLGQIRFPKNNIKAAFEDIRKVLEREGLLAK